MMPKKLTELTTVFVVAVSILLTTGCGGGSGNPAGPTTNYATSVLAPITISDLLASDTVYAYKSDAANVLIKLPVEQGTDVNYAMVVVNSSNAPQTIKLQPESYVLPASLRAKAEAEAVRASQRVGAPLSDSLAEARVRQYHFEEIMRRDFINSLRAAGSSSGIRQNRSLRLSDHSGEKIGDIVDINIIVAYYFSHSYSLRRCKLVRMTDHCKIFVDQNAYDGLSAAEGAYAITESDLDHLVNEFETHIYPLMNKNYGSVYDIDNDGCLSIVFSPVYPKIGFAGLFNTLHMNPTNPKNSNQRDMIGIWTPHSLSKSTSTGEKWLMDARETIAHEMQHAINFTAKVFPGDTFRFPELIGKDFNDNSYLEDEWLDESLSVGVEARYRLARGQTSVHEARFDSWAASPHSYGLTSWAGALAHYGQKGLFNYYLYEQYGGDKIKALVQTTDTGLSNLEAVYGKSMSELAKGFSVAVLNESLRTQGLINIDSITDSRYKFSAPVGITLFEQSITFGYSSTLSVPKMGTAYYLLKQPASFAGGEEFQFRIESTQDADVEIMLMRLPNP